MRSTMPTEVNAISYISSSFLFFIEIELSLWYVAAPVNKLLSRAPLSITPTSLLLGIKGHINILGIIWATVRPIWPKIMLSQKNVMDYIHGKHSIFNAKKSKTVMTMIKKRKKSPKPTENLLGFVKWMFCTHRNTQNIQTETFYDK